MLKTRELKTAGVKAISLIYKMILTDGQSKTRYTKRFPIQNLKSKIQNSITEWHSPVLKGDRSGHNCEKLKAD